MERRTHLIDFLPAMYRSILPEALELPLDEERNATCDRCAMCAPQEPSSEPASYFVPDTKCCTYHPDLPNYAVGGLLEDSTEAGSEGRRRILGKIERRIGVTPMGISAPAKQRVLYHHGKHGFGRSRTLVCPYLDSAGGRCTVWSHREGVCSTWFCKHNHGEDGRVFWRQVNAYLNDVQLLLSAYALRRLGFQADSIFTRPAANVSTAELSAADLDDAPPDDAAYSAAWGDWDGRESELYARAHDIVTSVDRATFVEVGGLHQDLALERLLNRYRVMREPAVPDPLLRNPNLHVRRALDGSYVLVSYTGIDPTRLRKAVYDTLDFFDGRTPTSEVRAAILAHAGLDLSSALLTKLYQYRILVAPDRPLRPL